MEELYKPRNYNLGLLYKTMLVSFGTFQGRFDLTIKIADQLLLYQTLHANHLKTSKLFKKSGNKEKPKTLMGR